MRFAYADPPYHGSAKKHYGKLHENASDYDLIETHRMLVQRLAEEFPDGWALSMSSTNLYDILPMCPRTVRIGAWVKPFAFFKPNVNPAYAWEPVIFSGGRKRTRDQPTIRDWVSVPVRIQRGVKVVPGAKPVQFTNWILDWLNVEPGDEIVDLFPGSGSVQRVIDWRLSPMPQMIGDLFQQQESHEPISLPD